MTIALTHKLFFPNPQSHLVEVETTVRLDAPPAEGEAVTLFMPVWTPGSYLVREYARHVESFAAAAPARATKVRKNAWRIDAAAEKTFVVRYRVYCNDLTVRTNHIDATHAYLNGAAVFLAVEGHDAPARIEIVAPEGWHVATTLPRASDSAEGREAFVSPDLDTLVDCPIEIGAHREERFEVLGKPHRYAIWPPRAIAATDVARMVADTKTILETEAALFGGALPYDEYLFLLHLSPRGRGGLEHRTSATLLANPNSFQSREGYLDLLSLIAHEAFHLWNVKRIRPAGLTPYRYQEENYTRLLWWFEGATSYYDWRVLRLARLASVSEYLDHLAAEIGYLDVTFGRLVQSLEDASFDAWIKLYRPDENSQNSGVSYYRKGELVCALLDIELRARTQGRVSLDQVLAHLWETYGAKDQAVPEGSMLEIFETVSGAKLGDLFDAWIRTPREIDYEDTLEKVGLAVERSVRPDGPQASLGVRLRNEGGRALVVSVVRGAAAHGAGIDPGDELIAIAGRRIEGSNLDAALAGKKEGDRVDVLLVRDGRARSREVLLDAPRGDRIKLVPAADAPPAARAAFAAWLGETHPAWEAASKAS